MKKAYHIYLNNVLYTRHVTFIGAKKHAAKLRAQGLNVSVAEVLE